MPDLTPEKIAESAAKVETLLDAMETCHICGAALYLEGPCYCEGCSRECEDHEGDECQPMQVLHGEARKGLSALLSAAEEANALRSKLADVEQANRVAADLLSQMEARAVAAESRTIPMVQEEHEVVDD